MFKGRYPHEAVRTGVAASTARDHVYNARGGFVYTSEHLVAARTVRPWAVVLISAREQPCEVLLGGRVCCGEAFAIRPQTERALQATNGGLVSINLHPTHAAYRSFLSIGNGGLQPLNRSTYDPLNDDLSAACRGMLTRQQGAVLFERLVDATLLQLPEVATAHASAAAILGFLATHPDAELANVAAALGLSYSRMSHVFKQAIGVSFRVFQGSLRMRSAGRQFAQAQTLTGVAHAAGFTDSAHLSHVWRRCYGLPPSYVRDNNCVQVVS